MPRSKAKGLNIIPFETTRWELPLDIKCNYQLNKIVAVFSRAILSDTVISFLKVWLPQYS